MKLLAVSLVAAASASNHTAVYGVHPPGLGAGVFSGLSNMQQCLFALVLDAKRHPGGGAAISLPSLRWRGSWSKAPSGSRYLPHEQVWSLDGWSSKLPPLIDAPPTIVDGCVEINHGVEGRLPRGASRQWAVTPSPRPQVVRGLAGFHV